MPGRRTIAAIDTTLCRRCQINSPTITVRTEPLCSPCFSKYVSTKIIKRMETFRVRNSDRGQEKGLLLPLSLGPSSTTLLHVLSQHLRGQVERTGRPGYKLHVIFVHEDLPHDPDAGAELFEIVKETYPDHTYSMASTSDIFSYENMSVLTDHIDTQNILHTNGNSHNREDRTTNASSNYNDALNSNEVSDATELTHVLSTLTPTSRTDVRHILLRRLVTHLAAQHYCSAILWAHSTTRLAERTLSETAKGRGFTLPYLVPDGTSPHSTSGITTSHVADLPNNVSVPSYYPLQDLLTKEVRSFTTLNTPPLTSLIQAERSDTKPAVSVKNSTIDDLMKSYFESVEVEYPSIVANVVKTVGKLRPLPPSLDSGVEKMRELCELCDLPLDLQKVVVERSRLCYGCVRTLSGAGTTGAG